MERSDFHTRARADWVRSIDSVVGPGSPSSVTWRGRTEIAVTLSSIMGSNRNHTHLPSGGGLDFESVRLSPEAGCLDFIPDEDVIYRMKPRRLILERIERDPAESFFLLELDELKPSGVYPQREFQDDMKEDFRSEELVELAAGEYYPRSVWDEGQTPDGRDLPDDTKLVIRLLGGKAMFVTKGSLWNGSPATYDGRHAKMTSADIRTIIERSMRA